MFRSALSAGATKLVAAAELMTTGATRLVAAVGLMTTGGTFLAAAAAVLAAAEAVPVFMVAKCCSKRPS